MSYCVKLREIVYDIAESLKQVSDDAKISIPLIAYQVMINADRLRSAHILNRDSGAYKVKFVDIQTGVQGSCKYVDLPDCIYDFDMDGGIDYIGYGGDGSCPSCLPRTLFSRTTPRSLSRMRKNPYETPSPRNPYFYRMGHRLYLEGVESIEGLTVQMSLYTTLPPLEELDLNAEFEFPKELLAMLKRYVMDMARWGLLVAPENLNEGSDVEGDQSAAAARPIVSVNDPLNNAQNA